VEIHLKNDNNRIQNEEIYLKIWVTLIDEKIKKSYLR